MDRALALAVVDPEEVVLNAAETTREAEVVDTVDIVVDLAAVDEVVHAVVAVAVAADVARSPAQP